MHQETGVDLENIVYYKDEVRIRKQESIVYYEDEVRISQTGEYCLL